MERKNNIMIPNTVFVLMLTLGPTTSPIAAFVTEIQCLGQESYFETHGYTKDSLSCVEYTRKIK